MNLNISPSNFDVEQINEEHDQFSCQVFFDSTDRDRTNFYNHHQIYQPHHHPEDDYYSSHGGSAYEDDGTNNKVDNGLKLTLWSDPVKWKPSRVLDLMSETKMNEEEDRVTIKINTSARNKFREDQKLWPSSSLETELSSNSSCNIVNNSPTVRVCSDCNTTKTPLWRSGPKGPKSLCNACGIRQRKARRAMAAAAAAEAATGTAAEADPPSPVLKIKVQQQNKQKISKIGHGQDSKFKKRSKVNAAGSSSSSITVPKKLNFEDFLIKLSKNLSLQRVFPQDEKDAAILLMALSSGLVHG